MWWLWFWSQWDRWYSSSGCFVILLKRTSSVKEIGGLGTNSCGECDEKFKTRNRLMMHICYKHYKYCYSSIKDDKEMKLLLILLLRSMMIIRKRSYSWCYSCPWWPIYCPRVGRSLGWCIVCEDELEIHDNIFLVMVVVIELMIHII